MMSFWRGAFAAALMSVLSLHAVSADPAIEFDRVGNMKVGTPLDQIRAQLEQPIQKFAQDPGGHCFYARMKKNQRYLLMFIEDLLARVEVMQPGLTTVAGIEVGDPISKVQEAYGPALKIEPDAYDDRERYLTATSDDGKYAIRFTTSNSKVSSIIFGTTKSVLYVEGCL